MSTQAKQAQDVWKTEIKDIKPTAIWIFYSNLTVLTVIDYSEAAAGRCSSKKVFLKISQYSHENTEPSGQQLYQKETPT